MVAHPRVLPVQHFARVAAGSEHSVALTSTGNCWAWGSNRYGEVGESSVATRMASLAWSPAITPAHHKPSLLRQGSTGSGISP